MENAQSERFPTFVATLGLAVTLWSVLVVPVDIYGLSTVAGKTAAEVASMQGGIEAMYLLFYVLIVASTFAIIPFAYFYYEEDDEDITVSRKIGAAFRYTLFTIVIAIILLVMGLIVKGGDLPDVPTDAQAWLDTLFDGQAPIEAGISFIVGCLTLLGCFCLVGYTAVGFGTMPVNLVRGKASLGEEAADTSSELTRAQTQRKTIEDKYKLTGRAMSKKDAKTVDLLKKKERLMGKKSVLIDKESKSLAVKCEVILTPFATLFGLAFGLVSLFLMISLTITLIDKGTNSPCGMACGFVLRDFGFNPFDHLLVVLSGIYPLDHLVVLGTVFYFFFTTISGIVRLGVRIGWVTMYRFKPGKTAPQGVLMTVIFLMLTLLAVNMTLLSLAPQYMAWGGQTYLDDGDDELPCSIVAPEGSGCTQSVVSRFFTRMMIQNPFFALAFFAADGLFLLVFFGSLCIAMNSRQSSFMDRLLGSDSDDDFL